MDEVGGARRGPPKLREILRRQRQDSEVIRFILGCQKVSNLKVIKSQQGTIDCPDLDFVYDDADKHPNETAELYSYTEGPEFQTNIRVCAL